VSALDGIPADRIHECIHGLAFREHCSVPGFCIHGTPIVEPCACCASDYYATTPVDLPDGWELALDSVLW